jgi:hypothetical protein
MVVMLGACGGQQIPQHNGYKSEKVKPWKKPKALQWNDKQELKTEGDLSYPDMRRAKWFAVDIPSDGELGIKLEVTPPGDAVNEDFDLAMEVFDPGYKVVAKADLEEQDAHELNKTRTVKVKHGQYLVHLYLQSRLDTAEFVLRGTFKAMAAAEVKTNFPALVSFVPPLPQIPISDDTPKIVKKDPPPTTITHVHHDPTPPPKKDPPPVKTATGAILAVAVVGGGTQITFGRGTKDDPPANPGMHVVLKGQSYPIASCTDHACTAVITGATPDKIRDAGDRVVVTP